jgi:hypothetical protein
MTQMKLLTANQIKTLDIITFLAAESEDGKVSEYAARTAGATMTAIRALLRRGVLTVTTGPFRMPTGPYAGEIMEESFYQVA